MAKLYSLRPSSTVAKDVSLETHFRVEMKRDDMGTIKPGDRILITSQTGKGGVGIAFLSSDTSKSSGLNSFVKVSSELRGFLGLELSEKCEISKFEGGLRGAKKVTVVEKGNIAIGEELGEEDLRFYVGVALNQLDAIIPGFSFIVTPKDGDRRLKKQVFIVEEVASDESLPEEGAVAVPFWYDWRSSKVEIRRSVASANGVKTPEVPLLVKPIWKDLPGLEKQLGMLAGYVENVNKLLEDRSRLLRGCAPILLHGPSGTSPNLGILHITGIACKLADNPSDMYDPSVFLRPPEHYLCLFLRICTYCIEGTGKSTVIAQLSQSPGWKSVTAIKNADFSGSSSKSDVLLAGIFFKAMANQPSLILFDDLETIAGRQSENSLLNISLATHFESTNRTRVQVVAAAQRPFDIDQRLLSQFKKLIELPTPNSDTRLKILQHFAGSFTNTSVLQAVAERTHAFNARDLDTLCREADHTSQQREARLSNVDTNGRDSETPLITQADFDHALSQVHPSLMNEIYVEIPKVKWSDIAGSDDVKRKLREAVELPIKHPEILTQLNIKSNFGALLYGPPGCSKTLIAKALATETGLNFISVKGPELISKFVGESERNIREAFRKARAAAPAIIFFDEFDSIAPVRGQGGHEGLNTVPTLLTELDGVEDVTDVLVVAATNRPNAIDPALLRHGRLGTHFFVAPPTEEAILDILKMQTGKMGVTADGLGMDLRSIAVTMAAKTEQKYSGADVAAVCEMAARICATEIMAGKHELELGLQHNHLLQALEDVRPSLLKEDVDALEAWRLGG